MEAEIQKVEIKDVRQMEEEAIRCDNDTKIQVLIWAREGSSVQPFKEDKEEWNFFKGSLRVKPERHYNALVELLSELCAEASKVTIDNQEYINHIYGGTHLRQFEDVVQTIKEATVVVMNSSDLQHDHILTIPQQLEKEKWKQLWEKTKEVSRAMSMKQSAFNEIEKAQKVLS